MVGYWFHRTGENGLPAKNDEEANNPVRGPHPDVRTRRRSAHQSEAPQRGVAIHGTSGALAPPSVRIEPPQGAKGGFLLSELQTVGS
jgi:hypothetical protein